MKKVIITLAVLSAIAGGVFWHTTQQSGAAVQESAFKTSQIKVDDLENIISSTGTLSAVSTVDVGSQVSGTLEKVYVDFNDVVTKGQLLAELDTGLLEAEVRDSEANVQKAKAQYAQSQAELERNRTLYEKGYLSESEYLTYSTDVQVKKAQVASAESSLFRARTNLGYGVIESPIDGIVIQRSVDPGQTIAASLQTPQLFIIAEDMRHMQIEVAVDESDIGQVEEGMSVRFDVQAYPDETFTGDVKQVRLQPETVSNVVNYTVIVNAENLDGKLLPGMTATVDFVVDQVAAAVLVPNAAMKYRPSRELMMAMREKHGGAGRGPAGGNDSGQGRGQGMFSGKGSGMGPDGAGGQHNGQSDVARVFVLNDDGEVRPVVFRAGVTDGAFTEVLEVLRGPETLDGLTVITSANGSSKDQRPRGMMGMGGPPPGGGGGMRRAGL